MSKIPAHAYPESMTTEEAWKLIDDTKEWAKYLEEESTPDSNDEYNAQEFTRLALALSRLVDERDALIQIRNSKENN